MAISRATFLASGAALTSVAIVRGPVTAAQFQYKLAHDLPVSHPIGVGANELAAAVLRESNGRLAIATFPDSILGSDPSMVTQLRSGAIQMSLQAAGPLSAIAPIASLTFVGFAFSERRRALAALDGDLGGLLRTELTTQNLLMLPTTWEAGFRQITTGVRPIRTVDDLPGLKYRVPVSTITTDMFRTLGASPVPITANELYSALQTHVVDAADGPFTNIFAQKLYEVQKYLSVTNHQYSGYWLVINGDAWRALPPDLQAIVQRSALRTATRQRQLSAVQNVAVADQLVRLGMQKNVADAGSFRARLGPYYAHWKGVFGPQNWSVLEKYSGKLG